MNAKTPTRKSKRRVSPAKREAAKDLERKARSKGAVGNLEGSLAKRRLRDTAIIAASAAGQSTAEIAATFEITDRTVRRILDAHRRLPTALDQTPTELLEGLLRAQRDVIADFEAMADHYLESNPTVALGAKRAAADARAQFQVLLESIGKLPEDLEWFRSNAELLQLADVAVDALTQVEAGEFTPVEAIDRVRSELVGELGSS